MWQAIHTLFGSGTPSRTDVPPRVPVVALVMNEQDRQVLEGATGQEPLEIHFAESRDEAGILVDQLTAPVVLLDRDWPGSDWKLSLERLAASPHRPCVILVSGTSNAYLWQELMRRGGYDLLAKPLRTGNVARVIKLALSYWADTPKAAVLVRKA